MMILESYYALSQVVIAAILVSFVPCVAVADELCLSFCFDFWRRSGTEIISEYSTLVIILRFELQHLLDIFY